MSLQHPRGRIVHLKNGDPLFLAARKERKMFKRRAAERRIFPSEPAAPSIASAPAPMTPSDSTSANLVYLFHVNDEEREDCANGEQPPPIQSPGPPGLSAVGYMFRRLRLRR
jgi:hypothetical protein